MKSVGEKSGEYPPCPQGGYPPVPQELNSPTTALLERKREEWLAPGLVGMRLDLAVSDAEGMGRMERFAWEVDKPALRAAMEEERWSYSSRRNPCSTKS